MILADLLADATVGLPGSVATVAPDGSVSWSRGGRMFAIVAADGASAEFALDPMVADAAARTPDVSPSGRGPGWVTFAPTEIDDHAADRAVAWLASAHRQVSPRD